MSERNEAFALQQAIRIVGENEPQAQTTVRVLERILSRYMTDGTAHQAALAAARAEAADAERHKVDDALRSFEVTGNVTALQERLSEIVGGPQEGERIATAAIRAARTEERERAARIADSYHEAACKWASMYVRKFDGLTDSARIAAAIRTTEQEGEG